MISDHSIKPWDRVPLTEFSTLSEISEVEPELQCDKSVLPFSPPPQLRDSRQLSAAHAVGRRRAGSRQQVGLFASTSCCPRSGLFLSHAVYPGAAADHHCVDLTTLQSTAATVSAALICGNDTLLKFGFLFTVSSMLPFLPYYLPHLLLTCVYDSAYFNLQSHRLWTFYSCRYSRH